MKKPCNFLSKLCEKCGTSEDCPNSGRKILDVAFEKLAPYFQELNKVKRIFIDVDELLKGKKNDKS